MRMSGLCKVEMSGFIQGGRRDGTGANRVECQRTGAVEGFAASPRRSCEASRSGPAAAFDRTAYPAFATAPASRRRLWDCASTARPALEPEDPREGYTACSAPAAPGALCGFRPTLAAEHLARGGIRVSRETLR